MRRKFINYREMIRRLEDFFFANKEKIESIPVLKKIFEDLFVEIRKFEKAWAFIDQDHKGPTVNKKNVKYQVVKQLVKCQLLLFNYCIEKNNLEDLPNFRYTEKMLRKYGDERLLSQIEYVITYMERMGDGLTATGLLSENLETLKSNYLTYESIVPRPRLLKSKLKLAYDDLEASYRGGLKIIKGRLDGVMKSFFLCSEPNFFNTYLETAVVEKSFYPKSAVIGKVIDKATKRPVSMVCIYIDSIDFMHEPVGKKGGFRIARLGSGTYKLRFEAPTYKTVFVDIIHRQGETNVVNVEMECISVKNEDEKENGDED